MANFPTLSTYPGSIVESTVLNMQKVTSSGKYTIIRRIGTRKVRSWRLSYDSETFLNAADKVTLDTFFDSHMGLSFLWTNLDSPGTILLPNIYTVFFDMTSLEMTPLYTTSGYYTTELVLTEL